MKRIGFIVLLSALVPLSPAWAQNLLWTRQLGTSANDEGRGVAVDSAGNAFITGYTKGSLGGSNAGSEDIFLSKYDASGALLWTQQMGTTTSDWSSDVAVDTAGNAYITGSTLGSLGSSSAGGRDAFVAKYNTSGALLWTRQLGTSSFETSEGVAVDGTGNVYITGTTQGSLGGANAGSYDFFLAKYNTSGALLWTRQLGTALYDGGTSVAVDSAGHAYIAGRTQGNLGGQNAGFNDAFVTKYDASGSLLWTQQIGTLKHEYCLGAAVDNAGNVFISGYTYGNLGGTNPDPTGTTPDAFLTKYDTSGTLLWTRQLGTSREEQGWGVAVDNAGNVYQCGLTTGSLAGPNAGGYDTTLSKYDASGVLLWTHQAGTTGTDWNLGVAVSGASDVYVTGSTDGSFGGANAGRYDVFLSKYGDAPCYADCDQSTGAGNLDVFDFLCFQNSFVNGNAYACDCDTSTGIGVCDVFDFLCFQDAFVGGCP